MDKNDLVKILAQHNVKVQNNRVAKKDIAKVVEAAEIKESKRNDRNYNSYGTLEFEFSITEDYTKNMQEIIDYVMGKPDDQYGGEYAPFASKEEEILSAFEDQEWLPEDIANDDKLSDAIYNKIHNNMDIKIDVESVNITSSSINGPISVNSIEEAMKYLKEVTLDLDIEVYYTIWVDDLGLIEKDIINVLKTQTEIHTGNYKKES